MIVKRRTLWRWGFRAGTSLAYFADPDLGQQRRDAVLAAIEPYGMRTRFGPMVTWLRSLNAGELTPPPTREQMRAARAAADAEASTPSEDDSADASRLTVVGHPRG